MHVFYTTQLVVTVFEQCGSVQVDVSQNTKKQNNLFRAYKDV